MVGWQIAASAISGAAALGMGSLLTHRLVRYRTGTAQETLREVSPETAPETTPETTPEIGPEINPEINVDRYRPMARLLDSEDLRFLTSRPGYRREVGARLRDSRRRIFRMYLAELSADFHRLHAAARRMASEAPEQHADLIPFLMRQQMAFWRSLVAIEVRLALSWAGLAPADARGLLEIVQQLQQTLAVAAPASAPA
jgi:hypothetical protein